MTPLYSRSPELVARGHVSRRSRTIAVRSNVYLSAALFERIRALAISDGMSFSATLRGLIVDGLGKRMKEAA